MSQPPESPSDAVLASASDSDLRLAQLLGTLIDQVRDGREPDLEDVVRKNPDLAKPLRELWTAVVVSEEIAGRALQDEREAQSTGRANATGGQVAGSAEPASLAPAATIVGSVDRQREETQPPLPRSFGDYEFQSELGRGGMGAVYKARQKSLNRIVAVKVLLQGELSSTEEQARFRAEAEMTARLEHPQIVPIYDVGTQDGRLYFSMKYIEGITLADRLADGPMQGHESARLLVSVCRAVHFAHQHDVLHRDLKPSNILLDRDGVAHVSDFGLAKRLQTDTALTRSGAILGTPRYMAPEQAAGSRGRLSPATDVYSLGTILYQMLCGRPPFDSASPVDTVLAVLESDPVPPRVLNPAIDRDLAMIVERCLQKPADLRYPSAAALADDLEAYLADEPVAARSGRFADVIGRMFRETHHAAVLENWGVLWMWHALALLMLCLLTDWFQWRGVESASMYLALWSVGLGTWAAIFWTLRRRRGPVTFIERQVAHVWASSIVASSMLFVIEILLELPVLTLSPVLGVIGGMVFLAKAGMLSGEFYIPSAILFLTAGVMALVPQVGVTLFGLATGGSFLYFGWKYHRQQTRALPAAEDIPE